MGQGMPRYCPRCGATTVADQRFCARCGLGLDPTPSQPGFQPMQQPVPQQVMQQAPPQYAAQTPGKPIPSFASKLGNLPPDQKRKLAGLLLLLAVLLLVGVAGYGVLTFINGARQPAITETSINSTIKYAGVTLTILKVQQSQSFIDDPNTSNTGMVRIQIQAQNTTKNAVNLVYNNIARLLMPGGKVLSSTYVNSQANVPAGATQTSSIDFAVPQSARIADLALRLGAADEAQMDVPLTGKADTGKYEPKTIKLDGKVQYQYLDWSLVSATTQLSIDGQQAKKNMHYVTLTLKVDNTLSQTAIPGPASDYIRLKAGGTTATPVNTTLPVSFAAGATGQSGTVTFLVPQNVPTLTLIMLAQPQNGFDQATLDFQL